MTRFRESNKIHKIKFMSLAKQIAKQFREVHLDGRWIANTNLKAELTAVTREEAMTKIGS